jgi:hypothetical protein
VLYRISYLFTEFGRTPPRSSTRVEVRTTGHGISAGAGKMGVFAGACLFPVILAYSVGLRGAEVVAGIAADVVRPSRCCPSRKARAWRNSWRTRPAPPPG